MSTGYVNRGLAPVPATSRTCVCGGTNSYSGCASCRQQQEVMGRRPRLSSGGLRRRQTAPIGRARIGVPARHSVAGSRPGAAGHPPARQRRLRRAVYPMNGVIMNTWGGGSVWGSTADVGPNSVEPQMTHEPTQSAQRRVETASDLVLVRTADGGTTRLQRQVAAAWSRMVAAARRDGIAAPLLSLQVTGNTAEKQKRAWEAAVKVHGSPAEATLWCTEPGNPASRSGLAFELDLGQRVAGQRARSARSLPAYRWLQSNARRFGFEPAGRSAARWRFVVTPPATATKDDNEIPADLALAGAGAAIGQLGNVLSIAQLGLGIAQFRQGFNNGTFSSNVGEFKHPNTPVDIPWYRAQYELILSARSHNFLADPDTFRYIVSFEYNGYDLRQLMVQNGDSNRLYVSSMTIAFESTGYSPPNSVNYSMATNISGVWSPVIGVFPFRPGVLLVDSRGVCSIHSPIWQPDDKVSISGLRLLSRTHVSGGHSPAPTPPTPQPNGGGSSAPPSNTCADRTRAGCSGPIVTELQQRLNRWLAAGGMTQLSVDGTFSSETAKAVVMFKKAHQLTPSDPVAGPKTWALLRSRY